MTTFARSTEALAKELVLDRDGCLLHATVLDGPGTPVIATGAALGLRAHSALALAGVVGHRKLVLLEVRGHGLSRCRHPEHYTWQTLSDDLRAWCAHLGVTRASLLGSSLGSIVSLAVAITGELEIDRLVLANPVFVGQDAPVDPRQEAALRALAAAFSTQDRPEVHAVAGALDEIMPGSRPAYAEALAGHADLASVASYFRLADRGPLPYTSGALRRLAPPTLIIGGRDSVHPAHVSKRLADLLPHARLLALDTAEPEQVLAVVQQAVSAFLLNGSHT